jgi:hypothetical protein
MKEPHTIEGQWWIHGDQGEPSQGTLHFDPEHDLTLTLHIFRQPDATTLPMYATGKTDCPHTIHGLDEHGHPVTLFGCSVTNASSTLYARHITIHAIAAIAGAGLNSWAEPLFRTARIEFSLLHNWTDQRRIKERNPTKPLSVELMPSEDLILTLDDGVKVRLSSDFGVHSSLREESFSFSHSIYLHFQKPESPETITSKWTTTLQHLLTLLIGERIFIDGCMLFAHDPYVAEQNITRLSATLLRSCRGIKSANRDRSANHMITEFKDLLSDLPAIVNKWFALDETLKPVVDLFMLVRSQSAPTIEMRFLVLAQALEAFHSRASGFIGTDMPRAEHRARISTLVACVPPEHQDWLREKLAHANQKTLANRLADIFERHSAEVALLTADVSDFANKVKNTRNYYTHYGEELFEKAKWQKMPNWLKLLLHWKRSLGFAY